MIDEDDDLLRRELAAGWWRWCGGWRSAGEARAIEGALRVAAQRYKEREQR